MNLIQRILHALGLYNPPEAAPAPVPAPIPPRVEPTPAPIPVIEAPRPPGLEDSCPAPGVFGAVDLSQPCTQRFLDTMKHLRVDTIIRYYDYANETLKGKTPKAAELALIKKSGLNLLCVFQHSNNRLGSFTSSRGWGDAERSLDLARLWGQPKGSAIYFGVDFDPDKDEINNAVAPYAAKFSGLVRSKGFRVGAYGSGLTLEMLMAMGLIDFAWLSQSTGFRNSKSFAGSGKWALKQVLPKDCGGIEVDFNYVGKADFGQWKLP